jgi:hypothetical protein
VLLLDLLVGDLAVQLLIAGPGLNYLIQQEVMARSR